MELGLLPNGSRSTNFLPADCNPILDRLKDLKIGSTEPKT
jgi:hypothetical protein